MATKTEELGVDPGIRLLDDNELDLVSGGDMHLNQATKDGLLLMAFGALTLNPMIGAVGGIMYLANKGDVTYT